MSATSTRSRIRAAACTLVVASLLASAAGVAAAAGTTDVGVTAARAQLPSGETTTVDVVVETAAGGVGALNATVALSNPDVASVERATLHGDPGLERTVDRDDGVGLSAALADTDDEGSVVVATVVLRGENPGRTELDVTINALGDEDGRSYTVGTVEQPTLTVVGDAAAGSGGRSAAPTAGTATATPGTGDGDVTRHGAGDGSGDAEVETPTPAGSGGTVGAADQEASAGSAPGDRVVEAFGNPASVLSGPMGVIGALVVAVAFARRVFR
mgnify:FL=1